MNSYPLCGKPVILLELSKTYFFVLTFNDIHITRGFSCRGDNGHECNIILWQGDGGYTDG